MVRKQRWAELRLYPSSVAQPHDSYRTTDFDRFWPLLVWNHLILGYSSIDSDCRCPFLVLKLATFCAWSRAWFHPVTPLAWLGREPSVWFPRSFIWDSSNLHDYCRNFLRSKWGWYIIPFWEHTSLLCSEKIVSTWRAYSLLWPCRKLWWAWNA